MTTLIEVLPRNWEDKIVLNPGAKIGKDYYESYVDVEWFVEKHELLSRSKVPLEKNDFDKLKSIDKYWKMNAERWRKEGII